MARILGIEHLMPLADKPDEVWVLFPDSEADVDPVTYPLYFEYNGEKANDRSATPPDLPDLGHLTEEELVMRIFGEADTSNEGVQ